jgi:Uma2 family endonuclease
MNGISPHEYLTRSYDPAVEYVDGALVERHAGEWAHALVQSNVLVALRGRRPALLAVTSLRLRTDEARYRIPDVCAFLSPSAPPHLIVEVLSESDALSAAMEKLREYARQGVANIWLIDPRLKVMSAYRGSALIEIEGETIATVDGAVELTRAEIFAE